MSNTKILLGPFSQLLTMDKIKNAGPLSDENLEIIENAGVCVEGGVICEIGVFNAMKKRYKHQFCFDSKVVALPGFIDAHTHICWSGSRAGDYAKRLSGMSYQEIAAQGGGILDTVRRTRSASEETLLALMLKRLQTLLQYGTTTCEVKSGYGLTVDDELKMLNVIKRAKTLQPINLISTCLAAHKRPPEFEKNRDYLNYLLKNLLPKIMSQGLSQRIDIFVEEGAFTFEEAKAFLLKAKALGFNVCVHADQFSRGGSLLASEVKAMSADHLEASLDEDLQALKRGGVIPIVLPGASLGLGMPYAPARKILDFDLPLTIASDWNPGSAPNGQLLLQASLMGASEKLSMAETLRAITLNAAAALGFNDRGVLSVGKRADLAIFPTEDYRDLLYFQGSMKPSHIFIAGEVQSLENDKKFRQN